jgi:hypothetical protein
MDKKLLEKEYPSTGISIDNLALTYRASTHKNCAVLTSLHILLH